MWHFDYNKSAAHCQYYEEKSPHPPKNTDNVLKTRKKYAIIFTMETERK